MGISVYQIDGVSSIPHTGKPWMVILPCVIRFNSLIGILHVNLFKAYRKQRLYFTLAGVSLVLRRAALPPCSHVLRHTRKHRHHSGCQFPSLVPPQRVRPPPIRVHGCPGDCQVATGIGVYAGAFPVASML